MLDDQPESQQRDRMIVHNGQISSLWPAGMGGKESRFAIRHESEASLLGVVFDPAGAMTGAPYRVVDASHWAFDGTGFRPQTRLPVARELGDTSLMFLVHPTLTADEIEATRAAVRAVMGEAQRGQGRSGG